LANYFLEGASAKMSPMAAVLTPVNLKRHQKVRAWTDLPGVPAGMPGKVLQVTGVSWIRYRVLFENGEERGLLDGRHIVDPKGWVPVDERVEEEAVADAVAEDGDAGDAAAAVADNPFGIPPHLLERSKAARERRAAL
jgi:hypothetical protein